MGIASESSIRAAIVALLAGVAGVGKVHNRFVRGLSGQEQQFNQFFRDDELRINCWMVRRVQRRPIVDAFNRVTSVVHVYVILVNYGLDEVNDSESTVQQLIEIAADAFEARKNLGLDGVTHRGLEMPLDLTDTQLGPHKVHTPELRLTVHAEDC